VGRKYGNSSVVKALTVCASENGLRGLERLYIFKDQAEVSRFLEKYPFLVPLLLEAYGHIALHFPYSQVFLEVVSDPEASSDSQLVAFIATSLAPGEAVNRLDRFDDAWWLDALDRAQGKLCVHLEFQ